MEALASPPRRLPRVLAALAGVLVLVSVLIILGVRGRHDPSESRVHADFRGVLAALEAYREDHPRFPDEGESLAFLVPRYLPRVPEDPWGRPYRFASDGERVFLATWGRDGVRGGAGPDEDHTQHDGHP